MDNVETQTGFSLSISASTQPNFATAVVAPVIYFSVSLMRGLSRSAAVVSAKNESKNRTLPLSLSLSLSSFFADAIFDGTNISFREQKIRSWQKTRRAGQQNAAH